MKAKIVLTDITVPKFPDSLDYLQVLCHRSKVFNKSYLAHRLKQDQLFSSIYKTEM